MTSSSAWRPNIMDDISHLLGKIEQGQDMLNETVKAVQHESKNRSTQLTIVSEDVRRMREDLNKVTVRMETLETKMTAVDAIWNQLKGAKLTVYLMVAGTASALTLMGKWLALKIGIYPGS
jgi:phage shock protein A